MTRVHRWRSAGGLATAVAVMTALTVGSAPGAGAAPAAKKVVKLSDKVAVDGHPVTGEQAKLTLGSTVPAGDKITSYALSFGDVSKTVKGGKVPTTRTHVYGRVGIYKITLTVADEHKKTAKATFTVIVAAAPGAAPAAGGATTGTVSPTPAPIPTPAPPGIPALVVTSADSAPLNLPTPRLIFSATQGASPAADRSFTFTNPGNGTLTVSNLTISGPDRSDFSLAPGQPTTFEVPAQQSVPVTIRFLPSAPTNCPTADLPELIANNSRAAALSYTSNDPSAPTGTDDVAGLIACGFGGSNEPVLDEITTVLGYTSQIVPPDAPDSEHHDLTPAPLVAGSDEVSSPYFTAANQALAVTLTPVAQYRGADYGEGGSMHTGWYAQGSSPVTASGGCTAACNLLWDLPPDSLTSGYVQNQKLLPVPAGSTTFTPSGPFGLYDGDFNAVNFTDDRLNLAQTTTGAVISPPQYLHDIRVFPAYGPGHVLIPDTYIVAVDITKVPQDKNDDYQDVVDVITNVLPAPPTQQ